MVQPDAPSQNDTEQPQVQAPPQLPPQPQHFEVEQHQVGQDENNMDISDGEEESSGKPASNGKSFHVLSLSVFPYYLNT